MENRTDLHHRQLSDIKKSAALIEMNPEGLILDASPKFLDLFGYPLQELLNQPHTILVHALKPLTAKESFQSRVFEGLKKNGEMMWIRGVSYPILDRSGNVERVIQFVYEITSERQFRKLFPNPGKRDDSSEYETFLVRSQRLAAKMSQEKTEFVTLLSHEIRSPLISLLGTADLLTETELNASQQRYAHLLQSSGHFLLNLLNDFLDLSKIEAKGLLLEETNYNLSEVIASVLDILSIKASGKQLRLSAIIDPKINVLRKGDPNRLRQILINLMDNAVKFTDQGEVQLQVISQDRFLDFKVVDTGIGIPEDKRNTLFQKFIQSDASISRRYGGTGLGLSISKSLVQLMGGEIYAENRPARGAVFGFKIVSPERENPEQVVHQLSLSTVKFFLAEAKFLFPSELIELLNAWGAQLEVSHDAGALVPPSANAVLVDAELYREQPAELSKMIEGCGVRGQPLCLIFPSIHDANQSQHEFKMVRPLINQDIFKTLYSMLSGSEQKQRAPVQYESTLTVLVAEDNPDIRFLIKAFLKSQAYELHFVVNGQEALSKIEENQFDLVLMDLQMPIMDGLSALRELRRIEKSKGISPLPVVVLTANSIDEIEKNSLSEFDDYLSKPFNKSQLRQLLARYAKKKAVRVA